MGFFNVFYRDRLRSTIETGLRDAVIDEFDALTTRVSSWAGTEHNSDGTHNVRPSGIDFVPVGGMIRWPLTTAPSGWLLCNGVNISRSAYPLLFKTIGITFGAGDGVSTFTLPTVANFIILAA